MAGSCTGKVYIVGAGPGDPELLTLKAVRLLAEADVVVYDRLAPQEALLIARPDAKLVYAGKGYGEAEKQEWINRVLLEEACRGSIVVRLKGGDPLIYGRGDEECLYLLERGVSCEVVPGVTSITAAAAAALAPPGSRLGSSTFAVAPGRQAGSGEPGYPYGEIASAVDTLILLMAAGTSALIAEKLMEKLPPETPVVVVERASMEGERVTVTDLRGLRRLGEEGGVKPPAVIIVGGAAAIAARAAEARRRSEGAERSAPGGVGGKG